MLIERKGKWVLYAMPMEDQSFHHTQFKLDTYQWDIFTTLLLGVSKCNMLPFGYAELYQMPSLPVTSSVLDIIRTYIQ